MEAVLHANEDRCLPGRHITDCPMRLYMSFRRSEAPITAAAKAGFSASTGYRFEQDERPPPLRLSHAGLPSPSAYNEQSIEMRDRKEINARDTRRNQRYARNDY